MPISTVRHYYPVPIPAPEPEPRRSKAEQARINGAKSRGPVTEEGKARSRQNACKHGLTATVLLVDPKDANAYNELKQGLIDSLRPQNVAEDLLVDNIARTAWKLRQADNIETDLLRDNLDQGETLHEAFSRDVHTIMQLSTYQTRLERRLNRLLDQFRKLQWDSMDPKRNPVRAKSPANHPMRSLDDEDFDPPQYSPNNDNEEKHEQEQEKNPNEPTDLNLKDPENEPKDGHPGSDVGGEWSAGSGAKRRVSPSGTPDQSLPRTGTNSPRSQSIGPTPSP